MYKSPSNLSAMLKIAYECRCRAIEFLLDLLILYMFKSLLADVEIVSTQACVMDETLGLCPS